MPSINIPSSEGLERRREGFDEELPFERPIRQLNYPLDAESESTLKTTIKKVTPELNRIQNVTLPSGAISFEVANSDVMGVSADASDTIETITSGYNGQLLTLVFSDTNVVIRNNDSGDENSVRLTSPFVSRDGMVLQVVRSENSWHEVTRNVNTKQEIIATDLETSIVDANGTGNTTTGSISPTANRLILAVIGQRFPGGDPSAPTLSGNGLTWVQVATVTSTENRCTLFRAMGASPSAGAVTINNVDSQNLDEVGWSIVEFQDMSIAGTNGSDAIVQSATNTVASASSLTVTLGEIFFHINNATFGGIWQPLGTPGVSPGTGFTEIGEATVGNGGVQSEFRDDNDLTVDWSVDSGSGRLLGVAVEIQ